MLYSYSNAFIWTLVYFFIGYEFGQYIHVIGSAVYRYGWYGLGIIILIGILVYSIKSLKLKYSFGKNKLKD
jgi:membrane protein DedA with SNARE-associated domain